MAPYEGKIGVVELCDGDPALITDVTIEAASVGPDSEAGAIIANYRNELPDKTIRILHQGEAIDTDVAKFGCLIGDNSRIGANAMVAPGALIAPGGKVGRLPATGSSR